ncbi:hypothetical protein [Nonlabens ulvanivorans]|uniref:hypothetical protein n=1 Tax=Nonlabens ulvanivorans TaxID=906888 RepID=UPI002943AA45|nr:hypothetical protein [Nonlabens ulvanivorans]WOI23048.1 hypothetical protein R1T42_01110 [Nonlabens ulvanivorans]
MRGLIAVLFISLFLIGCNDNVTVNQQILNRIPTDSKIIIATNDVKNLNDVLSSSALMEEVKELERIQELKTASAFLLDYDLKGESIIAISPEGKDDIAITLITDILESKIIKADSMSVHTYDQITYAEDTTHEIPYYYLNHNGFHIASTSRLVIESLIRRNVEDYIFDSQFASIYDRTSGSDLSIYIHGSQKDWLQHFLLKQNSRTSKVRGHWFQLEPRKTDHVFNIDGIFTYADSSQQFHAIFNDLKAQQNRVPAIIPSNVDQAVIVTYKDAHKLHRQVNHYNGTTSKLNKTLQLILDNSTELAQVALPKTDALVFSLKPFEALFMDMDSATSAKFDYRNFTIYELREPVKTQGMQPLLPVNNYKFLTVIEDYLILSTTATAPEEFIVSYQNKSALSQQAWWEDLSNNISDSSTLMYFTSLNIIQESVTDKGDSKIINKISSKDFPFMVSQYVHEKGYAHYHTSIPQIDASIQNTGIVQTGSYKSPRKIIAGPFLFPNHLTGKHDVAFQDEDFKLHLLTDTGKKHWSKQLDAIIIGQINAVDGYKNGRKQLAFSTSKSVYYLDRNGKDVNKYPIQIKGGITQPLSVFDYDNSRNYRFLVTHGKTLTMYDINGKVVKGFKYKKQDEIISQPQHYRVGSRDYIAFAKADNTISLLNRTGKVRTKVKEKVSLTGAMSFQKNLIKMLDGNQLIYLNPVTGKITNSGKTVSATEYYIALDGIEIIQNNNKLLINGKSIELPYGTYNNIKVDKLLREEYIHLIDSGENQVYLLDKKGAILNSFPVYGKENTAIARSKSNLLTTLDGDDIIIYKW